MDEMMEAVATEDTIPVETAESTEQDAPQAEGTVDTQPEQETAEGGEGTTPPPDTDDTTAQPAQEAKPITITIPIQFNHESREVTLDEAATIIQKSLKNEATMDKLRLLATGCGKTVDEMVETFMQANDRMMRDRFLQEVGGNEKAADILLAEEKRKRREAFDAGKQQEAAANEAKRQETTQRLADEFVELQKEFPDLDGVDKVPKGVLDLAANKGLHLMDAYLRYRHKERRRVEENRAQQAAAAAVSTGSLHNGPAAPEMDPLIAAMLDGVHAAL